MLDLSDLISSVFNGILVIGFWIACWLLPAAALLLLLDKTLGSRLRRQETHCLFLDLLDTILGCGAPVEETLVSVVEKRDLSPSHKFKCFAANLRDGQRLSLALENVPGLLPPKIVAMLRVGERIGSLQKVLPACRKLSGDKQSSTRSEIQSFGWTGIVTIFASIWMFIFLSIIVLPKFVEIMMGMTGELPAGLAFLRTYGQGIVGLQILVLAVVGIALLIHGESRLMRLCFAPLLESSAFRTPWKRRRMQRDFCTLLAMLLDAKVPEAEAVSLAADCAANQPFKQRAENVITRLRQGERLTDAIRSLDDSGEFRWRLTNATHSQGGFLSALTGWCESLDAKAFQQEQAAALTLTSALVLFNGLFVGMIVIATFGSLIRIVETGILW